MATAIVISGDLSAQVQIEVTDGTSGQPLPHAHVLWQPLDGRTGGADFTGVDGAATLPITADQLQSGVVVRVSHVGHVTRHDTLRSPAPLRIVLTRHAVAIREFVVTGQYGLTPAEQAVHKVRVLDAEHLERMAANDLSDALRNELNIRLTQDNALSSTGMTMQGLGGENVKILIDGVPIIGRQDGKLDLSQIDLNGIERVEVVEGPLSVNYGTNALAGTINLITRKHAPERIRVRASAYAEHIGRLNLWGSASRRWGRHHLNLDLGRDFFGGWNPGQTGPQLEPTLADTGRWKQWKPREQHNLRLNHRWMGQRWQLGYKGELSDDRVIDRGRPAPPYYDEALDAEFHTQRLDNALFADHYWRNGRKLTMLAAHDRYTRTSRTWRRDLTDLEPMGTGTNDAAHFDLTNVRMAYVSGTDSVRPRYEFGMDLSLERGSGDRVGDGAGEQIGDYAVYTSLEYRPLQRVTLRPAVRYTYNTEYGAPLIPSFNVRWQLPHDLVLRASYARGFRAPSLKELYLFFVDVNHNIRGNTDLDAERAHNISGSLTWSKPGMGGRWRAEVGGFHNDVTDLITLAQVNSTLYSYVNVGRYHTTGGHAGLGWEDARWAFTLGGNLTGRRDDLANELAEGHLWSHELRANLTRSWKAKGWSAQLYYKYQGELQNYTYIDEGSVGRSTLAGCHVADASVTKSVKERITITAGCKNLFDVQDLATTVTGAQGVAGTRSVPMMTGRMAFVRLVLQLEGKQR